MLKQKIFRTTFRNIIGFHLIIFAMGGLASCKKFLEVDLNKSEVSNEQAFGDELNANAAAAGMFKKMVRSTFAGGGGNGIPALTGLSSDELHNVLQHLEFVPFESNALLSDNLKVLSLWTTGYEIIYEANAIIENLTRYYSGGDSTKRVLRGEALFVRAYCHFYLTNLFQEIPIVNTTDYKANSNLGRSSVDEVYKQIISDLTEAQSMLPVTYVGAERVRPNKSCAEALLARVYLYRKDWKNAELNASQVIESGNYSIVTNLNLVFKKESNEVIWQLSSDHPFNTTDAVDFVTQYGPGSSTVALTDKLLQSFDNNDLRLANWVGTFNSGSVNIRYPYKYKVNAYGAAVTEHYLVLRLAEQFLIRAESRAMQGKYSEAIDDINKIKGRAGITLLQDAPGLHDQQILLDITMRERFLELFAEGGHRWFDLKRTGRDQEELKSVKSGWQLSDALYPIPQQERDKNPSLGNQNPNY